GLLAGSLLAFLIPRLPMLPRYLPALALASFLGVVGVCDWESDSGLLYGISAAELSACVMIIAMVQQSRSIANKVFSQPWLVWIGRRSYGIYLYHVPIVHFARELMPWPLT